MKAALDTNALIRWGWLWLATVLLLLPAGVPAAPGRAVLDVQEEVPVHVEADTILYTSADVATARGDVVVTRGTDTLRAREVVYNLRSGAIEAAGDVRFTQPGRSLQAEHLGYNTHTGAVSAADIHAEVPAPGRPDVTYYLEGQSLGGSRKEIILTNGVFTTCGPEHRHYLVRARQIILRPGDRLTARKVSLYVFGTRLFTIPRIGMSLKEGQGTNPLPRVIVGRPDAFGIRSDFAAHTPVLGPLQGYGVLSARHTIRAALGTESIAGAPVGLRLAYKEEGQSRFVPGVTVTEIPLIPFYFPASAGPKGFLQIGTHRPPSWERILDGGVDSASWERGRGLRLRLQGSAGRFIEHPTETIANRLNITTGLEVRPLQVLPHLDLGAALYARESFYSHDAHYGWLAPTVGLEWQPSRADTFLAQWSSQHPAGQTPFYFDRVEAPRTLLLRWDRRMLSDTYGIETQWDLAHGGVYAWDARYSHRIHCLQPGVVLSGRGGDLRMGVTLSIPGLGGQ